MRAGIVEAGQGVGAELGEDQRLAVVRAPDEAGERSERVVRIPAIVGVDRHHIEEGDERIVDHHLDAAVGLDAAVEQGGGDEAAVVEAADVGGERDEEGGAGLAHRGLVADAPQDDRGAVAVAQDVLGEHAAGGRERLAPGSS